MSLSEKADVRRRVRALMEAQDPAERVRKSAIAAEKILALGAFRNARCVCLYVSMPHEADTSSLIDEALKEGKRVVVPRCDMKTMALMLYAIQNRRELQRGTWGILEPEPRPERLADPADVECIVVPGVAFDDECNRVGNGKGFYDRFLKKLKPGTPKIGLGFSFQRVERLPVEPFDVRLDRIVTD